MSSPSLESGSSSRRRSALLVLLGVMRFPSVVQYGYNYGPLLFVHNTICHQLIGAYRTDIRTILVTMYYYTVVMLGYDWWLCMVINLSVQYNGGLLPDTILLTHGYYHWGTRLNTM